MFKGIYFGKFCFVNHLITKELLLVNKNISHVAKTKKYSTDGIAMVSFCVLRCDCYVRTIALHGSDIPL